MNARVVKLFSCCIDRAVKDTDSPLMIKRKRLLIIASFFGIFMTSNVFLAALVRKRPFIVLSMLVFYAQTVYLTFVLCVLRWQPTDRFLNRICGSYCLALMIGDYDSSIMQENPIWPLFVPLIDILLVLEAPSITTYFVVGCCCSWLFVISIEKFLRIGMFDLEWQNNDQHHRRETYDCDKLPCAREFMNSAGVLSIQLFVFLLDFFCTRGFATAVLNEKKQILSSIETANLIAGSLSRFDLDGAAELLDDATIPGHLREAFAQILCNLCSYRPYLPQSCFPEEEEPVENTVGVSLLSSDSSASSTTRSSRSAVSVQNGIRHQFESLFASLLVGNIRNSFQVLESSHKSFESLISVLVSTSSDIIREHRGTIDLFLGDRMFARFNKTKYHGEHAPSCVDAATAMVRAAGAIVGPYQEASGNELSVNFGLGSGKLYCGDLGSTTLMRYSVIGKLSVFVGVIERVSNLTGTSILAEEGIYRLVKHTAEVRVHLQTVLFNDSTHLLYEIVPKAANIKEAEWMYQMEQAGAGKWDAFNKIAKEVLLGDKQLYSTQEGIFDNFNSDDTYVMRLKELVEDGPPDPMIVNY